MAIQIRPLTPHEKTGQISAYGGLVVCDQAGCDKPANYLAVAVIQRMKLCEEHKRELEAAMGDKEAA